MDTNDFSVHSEGVSAQESPAATLSSAYSLLKESIAHYGKHGRDFMPLLALPAIVQSAVALWRGPDIFGVLLVLASFVISILSLLSLMGVLAGGWSMSDGIPGLFRKCRTVFFPWVWTHAYVVLVIIGGFFLFGIPGLYASITLSLVSYVFFTENKKGVPALIASWWYVKGRWWRVLWRFIFLELVVMILSLALSLLTSGPSLYEQFKQVSMGGSAEEVALSPLAQIAGIGFQLFVAVPITMIYSFLLYQMLRASKPDVSSMLQEEEKIRKTIKIFMTVGVVGLVIIILLSGFFIFSILNPSASLQ